ncbi:hypothetical protein O4H66_17240 [Comamonadaceae bacterium G21597-S1]|nr:hypothetical protein [Comamonadaceae bacterium G21597-S1]
MTAEDDLRSPNPDETELSTLEVRQGLRDGSIPPGPRARARAFADAWVWERRRVEVHDFYRETTT